MTRPAPLACGLCPRCSAPTLFAGIVGFAPECRICRLDLAAFNVGDGPAAFLTLGIGALIVTLAILFELALHPPFWLHLLLWTPLAAAAAVVALRIAKGTLLAIEYRTVAREGRVVDRP